MIIETSADVAARAAWIADELVLEHGVLRPIAEALAADLLNDRLDCFERWRRLYGRTLIAPHTAMGFMRKHGLLPERSVVDARR